MLQVNGKLRGAIVVPASSKADIEKATINSEPFKKRQTVPRPKVIVVPGPWSIWWFF
jgi:hypothetical protein